MLKFISAALLAASVVAAPALAAGTANTSQVPANKTAQAPADKAVQVKPKALNANAKMTHRRHYRHHRAHKHMGALKSHKFSNVTNKHLAPATKRG